MTTDKKNYAPSDVKINTVSSVATVNGEQTLLMTDEGHMIAQIDQRAFNMATGSGEPGPDHWSNWDS